jgi:hypothetical protein
VLLTMGRLMGVTVIRAAIAGAGVRLPLGEGLASLYS